MWRWRSSKGVDESAQKLLAALDRLDERVSANHRAMLAYPAVSAEIRSWAKGSPDAIRKLIEVDGRSPDFLCFAAVAALVERDMTSGENHVYRGTLSGYGQSLDAIYKVVALERMRMGFADAEQLQAERRELDASIREVG